MWLNLQFFTPIDFYSFVYIFNTESTCTGIGFPSVKLYLWESREYTLSASVAVI